MIPDVTVVIPTRNRAGLLRQTLVSVLDQRDVRIEVVVVDDASEDDTARWLAEIADSRIRYIRHDSAQGPSAARNTGLAQAGAPWVAFVDDDDLWAPQKLAAQLDALKDSDCWAWSFVGTVSVTYDLAIISPHFPHPVTDLHRELLRGDLSGVGHTSACMVGTELAREVGGFDVRFPTSTDKDFWIRLAAIAPVVTVSRPLSAYRMHAGGVSRDVDRRLRGWELLAEKYRAERAELGVEFDFDEVIQRSIASLYLREDHRAKAARQYVRLAARERSPRRAAVGAAIALGLPVQERRDRRNLAWYRRDTDWIQSCKEAEEWLGPLREHLRNLTLLR